LFEDESSLQPHFVVLLTTKNLFDRISDNEVFSPLGKGINIGFVDAMKMLCGDFGWEATS
jgi:hypothetical protein